VMTSIPICRTVLREALGDGLACGEPEEEVRPCDHGPCVLPGCLYQGQEYAHDEIVSEQQCTIW